MEYLQYLESRDFSNWSMHSSFKPYYKWNTFNTQSEQMYTLRDELISVLNLIINGIPSIPSVS